MRSIYYKVEVERGLLASLNEELEDLIPTADGGVM